MVPGSTFRYGSSFCMLTRSPRSFRRRPMLDAVRPLPRLEATPPVTKRCRVLTGRVVYADIAKAGSRGLCRQELLPVHGVSGYQAAGRLARAPAGSGPARAATGSAASPNRPRATAHAAARTKRNTANPARPLRFVSPIIGIAFRG